MGLKRNASIRFTSSVSAAFDPVIYEELTDRSWKRFERTMRGEKTVVSGHILHRWETATGRQHNLARTLDRLLDERPFLQVDLFEGIYRQLSEVNPTEPAPQGVLVMVVTPEPWQHQDRPSRQCSIDWRDATDIQTKTDVQTVADTMLDRLSFYPQILEIRTYLIDTEEGGITELAYEIPLPDGLQPVT